MNYQYLVVPFIGSIKGKQGADVAANQLTSLINQHAAQGWEFYQMADINIEVQPGCIAGLFGASVSYIRLDQLVFRRPA